MADISFYQYLEAAFRHRLFNPEGKRATLDTHFKYLQYNLSYDRIFYYARKVLPKFYTDPTKFPNTEEGNLRMAESFLQKLDRHQDPQLERLFDPAATPEENVPVIQQAVAEQPVAAEATPSAAQEAPIQPTTPPFVGPGIGLAQPASLGGSFRTRPVTAEKAVLGGPSKTIETGLDYEGKPYNLSAPKMPYAISNAGKNLGINAGTFFKTNAGRVANGLSNILGGVGEGGIRLLGKGGGFGLDAITRLSNPNLRGSIIKGPSTKIWAGAVGVFGLVFIFTLFSAMAIPGQTPTTSEAAPVGILDYILNGGSGIVSCPTNGGVVTTGSKDTPGGHCSVGYQQTFPCASPDVTGRATAVDLQSSDRMVFLPYLNGEKVSWTVTESGTVITINEGGGFALAATASSKGKSYTIRFVHINLPSLRMEETALAGTAVAPYITTANHVHVTIQEDGVFKPADSYFNLCK